MKDLLDKARRLTLKERKELAKEGIYLASLNPEKEDQATLMVFDMLLTEEEQERIDSAQLEQEFLVAVVKRTYGVEEKDAKN